MGHQAGTCHILCDSRIRLESSDAAPPRTVVPVDNRNAFDTVPFSPEGVGLQSSLACSMSTPPLLRALVPRPLCGGPLDGLLISPARTSACCEARAMQL